MDSAPTGHLLRMLNLPSLLTPWVQGLVRQREAAVRADRFADAVVGSSTTAATEDPLLQRLHARRYRLEQAAQRLGSEDSAVRLVLVPRHMVIAETYRATEELRDAQVSMGPAVINQVPEGGDVELLDAARAVAGQDAIEVPMLAAEPRGVQALRDVAALL